jgi:ribosome-associated translation inhibitor RaiA
MRIEIHSRHLALNDTLKLWIETQIRQIFAACADRIGSVHVSLSEEAAPTCETVCRIVVRRPWFREIVVTDRNQHLPALIKSTARRAAGRIRQCVNRARVLRRSGRERQPALRA